ncbi:unnamed protein product, partial [marine sediment metagenome]
MTGPMYVDWAITSMCNLNCRHCVGMEKGELTSEEATKIANDIIGLSPRWVILEGGEPLLRKDFHQIGGVFQKAGIDVFVITNGNAFNQDRLQKLASFSPKVLFSFDGADAAVYEYTKRGAKFVTAYALEGHRHLPEIIQELSLLRPQQLPSITFVPHLIPMTRGILTTCYAPLSSGKVAAGKKGEEEIRQLYLDFYKDEPFIRVVELPPHTKHTWGNNLC